jgi:beta-phosphoglucomutase-like phosphatase (HAD superfamily)
VLGLPDGIQACLFDLDGVLTRTAKVHAAAWKVMFDEYLKQRADAAGGEFVPFDDHDDYDEFVDGLPRADGVRSFLRSRGIEEDPQTVQRLSDRKNTLVLELIHREGVEVYEGSVRYVEAAQAAGLKLAVVSSSANAKDVLLSVGILDRFDTVVDGHDVA